MLPFPSVPTEHCSLEPRSFNLKSLKAGSPNLLVVPKGMDLHNNQQVSMFLGIKCKDINKQIYFIVVHLNGKCTL